MTLPLSSSILLTVPSMSANGPSTILTASLNEKEAWNLGVSWEMNFLMASTSSWGRRVGCEPVPTKPVMPWVVRTASQESSLTSMRIRR